MHAPIATGRRPPVGRSLRSARVGRFAAIALCVLGAACSTARPDARSSDPGASDASLVLTREDIRTSGARDALEAIERSRSHLVIQRTGHDHAPRIYQRGVSSFNLSSQILVVVDGARMDFIESDLRGIPATSIASIHILSGRQAAMQFGSEAGNGVILIRTSAR